MATTTEIDRFPKATVTQAQVEAEAAERRHRGAISSEITDDAADWILTTVWPVE